MTEFNMTCAVRRMDENIVEVRHVYALELTITYGMNRGRFLENNRTTGSPSLGCDRTTRRKVIYHTMKTAEIEKGWILLWTNGGRIRENERPAEGQMNWVSMICFQIFLSLKIVRRRRWNDWLMEQNGFIQPQIDRYLATIFLKSCDEEKIWCLIDEMKWNGFIHNLKSAGILEVTAFLHSMILTKWFEMWWIEWFISG